MVSLISLSVIHGRIYLAFQNIVEQIVAAVEEWKGIAVETEKSHLEENWTTGS